MSQFICTIDAEVLRDHPGYCLGILVFHGLDNRLANTELTTLLRAAEASVRARITGNVAEHPHIAAWRDAYRRFGSRPSDFRSSIEALSRRVLKPDALPDINKLVDIGNLLSLRHLLPMGVHPLHPDATIELRKARAGDSFIGDVAVPAEDVHAGEIVLAAGSTVLTRRWTWRQSADSRILPETDRVFLNVEGLPPVSEASVRQVMTEAIELVGQYCGGELIGADVLHEKQPTLRFA